MGCVIALPVESSAVEIISPAVVCADMQWHGVAGWGVFFLVVFSLNYPFRELSRVIFYA